MAYLVAADVLPLAGYPADYAGAAAALTYAEFYIDKVTGLTFAASPSAATIRVHTHAKTYYLPLPYDVATVSTITPNANSYTLELATDRTGKSLRWLDANDEPKVFEAGFYKLTITKGIAVDKNVNKAGSLLAAHYLAMSDPERSRFANFSQGDISGSMRLDDTPVPEATALLRSYPKPAKVALV